MRKKNGKWTIKNTREIFANDFFKVFEDEVIAPDGKDEKYATIEFQRGVSILPVDDDNNIFLTKQFRYALEREDLESIAGAVNEEENYLEAAKREAREELGLEAKDWIFLGKIEGNTSIAKSENHLYLARDLTFDQPAPEGTEQIKPVKIKLEKAVEKVMNGEITHDLTCILILKTNLFQNDIRKNLSYF